MIHLASQTALSWYWLWHPLIGPGYQFYSGIGSDFSELTLLGIAIGAWRHVNCHTHHCWRRGKHVVAGGTFKVCTPCLRQIDPAHDTKHTVEHIRAHHRAAKDASGGRQRNP